jgi:hypothetical protein
VKALSALALFFCAISLQAIADEAPHKLVFPTFGVAALPPDSGWTRVVEGGLGHVARWANPNGNQARAVLTVEMEPVNGRTLNDYSQSLQKKLGGTPRLESTKLASLEAIKIRTDGNVAELHPAAAVVAVKDGFFYVLALFESAGWHCESDLERLRQGFELVEQAAPADHLRLRGDTFPMFDLFKFEPLDTLRPVPTKGPATLVKLAIHNYVKNAREFEVEIELVRSSGDNDLIKLREKASNDVAKYLALQRLPEWKPVPGVPGATATEFLANGSVTVARSNSDVRVKFMRVALFPFDDHHAAFFFMRASPDDDDGLKRYATATDEMLKSVKALPQK